jgi:hypothetical protein
MQALLEGLHWGELFVVVFLFYFSASLFDADIS